MILELSEDDEVYLVNVPAFPEVHTFGESVEQATVHAKEAIDLAVEMYLEEGKVLPNDPAVVVEVAS